MSIEICDKLKFRTIREQFYQDKKSKIIYRNLLRCFPTLHKIKKDSESKMNQNGKRVHAATQQQYWSDSSDSEDDDDLKVLDMRIFQGSNKSSYLSSKQEVKAQNGYVWCKQDQRRSKN